MTKAYAKIVFRPLKRMANTPKVLALAVIGTLLLAAGGFMALEGVSPLDSFYWASTTMTSVGYGDLSPASAAGKIMTVAFQIWSMFVLLPCAISNIIDSVRVDEHKMTNSEQEWMFSEIEEIARRQGREPKPQPHNYE